MNTSSTSTTTATKTNKTTKPLFRKPKKRKLQSKQPRRREADDDERDNNNVDIGATQTSNIPIKKEEDIRIHNNSNDDSKNNDIKLESRTIKQEDNSFVSETNLNQTEDTVLDKIQSIQKNRKLKSFARNQIKIEKLKLQKAAMAAAATAGGGGNLMELDDKEKERLAIMEANQDLKERLEGNFASTKSNRRYGGGNGVYEEGEDEDGDGGVLRKKHRIAMEQYIQSQMMDDANNQNEKNVKWQEGKGESQIVKDKKDLYSQLLQSSGFGSITASDNNKNDTVGTDTQEGDVGAGGEMLGGTGIAEVILSVEDRIKNIKDTEVALAKRQGRMVMKNSNTMTGASSGTHSSRTASSAGSIVTSKDVSNVGGSYAHNFRLHNSEWIENKKKQERAFIEATQQQRKDQNEDNELNQQRVGFHAKRGLLNEHDKGSQQKQGGGRYHQSSDDQTWKKFVRNVKR